MEQWEYKCKADGMFGLHEGPENYECQLKYDKSNWFSICEKHAIGVPYGVEESATKWFTVRPIVMAQTLSDIEQKPQKLEKPAPICFLTNNKFGYGQCDGPITHEFKKKSSNKLWAQVCEKHVKAYQTAGEWEIRPFYEQQNPLEYKKYEDAHIHRTKEGTYWFCDTIPGKDDIGKDGTKLHWGTTYELKKTEAESWQNVYRCDNHAHRYLIDGYKKISFGANGQNVRYTGVDPIVGVRVITKEKIIGGWPIRTQKARGIAALKKSYFDMPEFSIYDVEGIEPSQLIGKFVRPCPMRPRHGFVDSRLIEDEEQAQVIIKETLEADSEAEFVIMPFINAEFSGIWTTGHLAIGLGTDGATAGKSAITLPVIGDALKNNGMNHQPWQINENAGVKEAPYVELLWQKKYGELTTKFVQLRDGPKLPSQIDYIPVKIKVEFVRKADGDLLAWETAMKNSPPGTVIDHVGGSLASHYAIHAVLNNIPVLVSRHPVIGEELEPTQDVIQPVDIQALRAGFTLAQVTEMTYKEACYIMLAGCHHVVAWSGKQDLLLGFAMGCAWRLTLIAALGERRHHRRSHGGRRNIKDRDQVYSKAWEHTDEPYTRKRFMEAIDCFLNGNRWPGSKYGGKSWYKFAANSINMYNALIAKEPARALEALNQLVHSAHNTGWGFNKFIDNDELDKTASNPIYACLKIAPFLYQMVFQPEETLKSAARSFWKRSELVLPHDRGTGSYSDNDDEGCQCSSCQKGDGEAKELAGASAKRTNRKLAKPHIVTYAQAKNTGDGSTHIQWKARRMHGKGYFTKDVQSNLFDFVSGVQTTSLSGSHVPYTKLVQGTDGWYLPFPDMTPGYRLLKTEEIPVPQEKFEPAIPPMTYKSCPCYTGLPYGPHSGPEKWVVKSVSQIFSVCDHHKPFYEKDHGTKITLKPEPVVEKQVLGTCKDGPVLHPKISTCENWVEEKLEEMPF